MFESGLLFLEHAARSRRSAPSTEGERGQPHTQPGNHPGGPDLCKPRASRRGWVWEGVWVPGNRGRCT